MAHGGKRPGAGRKRGGQNDPRKALVKAADKIAAELAIAITGDVAALGKDRLTELDNMAVQMMKLFAPRKDEEGNAYWLNPGDEARFMSFLKIAGKYAEARAPYESPRLAAIAVAQQHHEDPDEGIDPRQKLIDMVDRWIDAQEAETPAREPEVVEVKPEPDDVGDGEAV
jgi:hypothetical protein